MNGPEEHEPYWETTEPYQPFSTEVLDRAADEPTERLPRAASVRRRPSGGWAGAVSTAATAVLLCAMAGWVLGSVHGRSPAPTGPPPPSVITVFPSAPAVVVTLPPGMPVDTYRPAAPVVVRPTAAHVRATVTAPTTTAVTPTAPTTAPVPVAPPDPPVTPGTPDPGSDDAPVLTFGD